MSVGREVSEDTNDMPEDTNVSEDTNDFYHDLLCWLVLPSQYIAQKNTTIIIDLHFPVCSSILQL